MKLNKFSLSLAVAVCSAISVPAYAADWNYGAGSIKDMRPAAVPVPAPVPVPDYAARYYFRADIGIGMGDAPESSETGYYYGSDSDFGPSPSSSSWLQDDFDTFVTFGVGAGMYVGNGFRIDATAETRSEGDVKINGSYEYESRLFNDEWDHVRGTVRDKISLSGGIFMLNAYYDFNRGPQSRFTPYVGAGLGFAWNELKRVHTTRELSRTCNPTDGCTGYMGERDSASGSDKTHDLSLAAMATVGLGYRLNEYSLLDFNYRYLYVDGTDIGMNIDGYTFGGDSKVSIGEMHEHQLRAGLRFDVN